MKSFFSTLFLFFAVLTSSLAQERPIEIEDKQERNRLYLYAVNKNLQDFDVTITVTGTGFRQRAGIPRAVRVPARSKVQISSLIIERGKEPNYKYTLAVSEELSRRALVREADLIKIMPKWPLTIYKPNMCAEKCDSLIAAFVQSPYRYTLTPLAEFPKVREQMAKLLVGGEQRLSEMDSPIVTMGGKMFLTLSTYEEIMEEMEKN